MRILAISGSLRAASFNTALLRAAADVAPEGVEVELFTGLDRLPAYNEDADIEPAPPEVARLRSDIATADALIISTPEFNGTMPGHLKTAIDWASRPYGQGSSLWGKPALVIGASVTDYGAIWAQDHARKALGIAGARVHEGELALAKAQERFNEGTLEHPDTEEQLVTLIETFADSIGGTLAQAA
jgi:NAD(P)H-dependent FMN reductase